jgi:hypothetical protein
MSCVSEDGWKLFHQAWDPSHDLFVAIDCRTVVQKLCYTSSKSHLASIFLAKKEFDLAERGNVSGEEVLKRLPPRNAG